MTARCFSYSSQESVQGLQLVTMTEGRFNWTSMLAHKNRLRIPGIVLVGCLVLLLMTLIDFPSFLSFSQTSPTLTQAFLDATPIDAAYSADVPTFNSSKVPNVPSVEIQRAPLPSPSISLPAWSPSNSPTITPHTEDNSLASNTSAGGIGNDVDELELDKLGVEQAQDGTAEARSFPPSISHSDLEAPNSSVTEGNSNVPVASPLSLENEDSEKNDDLLNEKLNLTVEEQDEKFIVPLLSSQVGTGNQLMEYKSAAVIARTLNRTLCLTPFFSGPSRHFGALGNRHEGNTIEERYDMDIMAKYVKIASLEYCLKECEKTLHGHWKLRPSRPPSWDLWDKTPNESMAISMDRRSGKWASTADIVDSLGPFNQDKCVGLGGLFPGLRWRGAYRSASAYLQPSLRISKAAYLLQKRAIGLNQSYLSVHWRFEESNCNGHPLGLCFSRCGDGKVIVSGLVPAGWANLTVERKTLRSKSFQGVGLTVNDIAKAIYARATLNNVQRIYLATDGWLRGPESTSLLKWVVQWLRKKRLIVTGLWMVRGLPNFEDGSSVHPDSMASLFGSDKSEDSFKVNNHMISLVEQEICSRATAFLGSGPSSWSLAVFDNRMALKRAGEERSKFKGVAMESAVIEQMLSDRHTAGPTCRGSSKPTVETEADEFPDGWLDYEACEKRIALGGGCIKIISRDP